MRRTFIHLSRAWYGRATLNGRYVDEVCFGLDGANLPHSEFMMRWYEMGDSRPPAPRLEVFDDSWAAIELCSDVLAWMATVNDKSVTPQHFCQALIALGFEDDTPVDKERAAKLDAQIEELIKRARAS